MVLLRHTIFLFIFLAGTFGVHGFSIQAQSEEATLKPGDRVEIVLKAGRTIVGDLVRDSPSQIELRIGTGKVRVNKINIKTINGQVNYRMHS